MTASRKKVPSTKRSPTGDYGVGYARPPTGSQYQKGQSGNPKGRPRRSRNNLTLIKEAIKDGLSETVSVRVGGDVRHLSMAQALGIGAVTRAAKNSKDLEYLLRLYELMGIKADDEYESPEEEMAHMEGGEKQFAILVDTMIQRGWLVVKPGRQGVEWDDSKRLSTARMNELNEKRKKDRAKE